MPPRFAYWTILIDNAPTAFRARDAHELLPTLNQLKRTNQNVILRWFSGGQLWESPEAASEARRKPKVVERRGKDWRPGGQHKDPRARFDKKKRDSSKRDMREGGRPAGPRPDRPRKPWTPRPPGQRPLGAQKPFGGKPSADRRFAKPLGAPGGPRKRDQRGGGWQNRDRPHGPRPPFRRRRRDDEPPDKK